jgi:site-specific DNA-cytosine methylase
MFLKSLVDTLPAAACGHLGPVRKKRHYEVGVRSDRCDHQSAEIDPSTSSVVKPLLDSKLKEMAGVKKEFANGDKREDAKNTANESLKAISSKYDSRITSTLNPDQLKKWTDLSKGWNSVM